MIRPAKFQLKLNALTLWRDGQKAVVSMTINGRSVRILEADCRTMFFETAGPELLKELSWEDYTARRRARRRQLEAAE